MIVIGVDEAGRGALAGPVVAGAVYETLKLKNLKTLKLTDSKQMTEAEREVTYEWIMQNCDFGIGIVGAEEIDHMGIKKANEKAMNIAVQNVGKKPDMVLVDGRDRFVFPYPSKDIVKGDEKEICIAAGSIIAKVTRDRLMKEYDKKYPKFGFAGHKGYGSEEHRRLLEQEIYCEIHRKSYDPLRTVLTQGKLF